VYVPSVVVVRLGVSPGVRGDVGEVTFSRVHDPTTLTARQTANERASVRQPPRQRLGCVRTTCVMRSAWTVVPKDGGVGFSVYSLRRDRPASDASTLHKAMNSRKGATYPHAELRLHIIVILLTLLLLLAPRQQWRLLEAFNLRHCPDWCALPRHRLSGDAQL
jgi:hypothetical protein